MRKRTGARGTAVVEYAMLVIALMVGGAAAKKAMGARVTDAASQAIVALGGNAIEKSGDERSGVTQLPNVGAGPSATKEQMAAADKNKDGVLSPEEQLALQTQQQKKSERLALSVELEKKRHESVNAVIRSLP